jgi:hypothetical protein
VPGKSYKPGWNQTRLFKPYGKSRRPSCRPDKSKKTDADGPIQLGDVMKITTGLLAGVAVLAMAQTAHAAPKVAGKYILMSFSQCRAEFTTTPGDYRLANGNTGPAVRTVNPGENGEINIGVGSITFPDDAASAGTASLELSIVAGASLKINTSGGNIGTHTENPTGTFAITGTTFTFTPEGEPAMTWTMRAGDFKTTNLNGVARTFYLTRRENTQCINALTATKQLP